MLSFLLGEPPHVSKCSGASAYQFIFHNCLTFHSLIQRLLKKKNFILTCSFSDIGSKKCFIEKPSGHDVFKLNMKCVTLDVEKIKKILILTLTY